MIIAGLCAAALSAAPMAPADAKAFRGDVDFVTQSIVKMHPAPFAFADRGRFFKDAAAIKSTAAKESLGCAVVQLMGLVAELHDGHSYIAPVNIPKMERWFPVRFYAFPDGLYVTSVTPDAADLAGKRVLRIGGLDADAVLAKVVAMQDANNPLNAREGTVWLSNADIAQAIGAAQSDAMAITVADAGGKALTRTLKPFTAELNDGWYQQGEMFGPRAHKDAQPYVTAFGGRGPLDFRKTDPLLPPHLRYRLPYYMVEFPGQRALYIQWNFVQDWGDGSFKAFTARLFKVLDAHPDWKLIVDVRYNSGGDGSKVPDVIRQIIKRDRFDQPGNLFIITGRKTFSAAVDFVGEAHEWTSAIFVGEPTGAGLNAYGDPEDRVTPGLHIPFQVSTAYHQHAPSQDHSGAFNPDIPAVMTAADYFAGRDGALETILNGSDADLLPIPALGVKAGAAAANTAQTVRLAKWHDIAWWQPFSEDAMNSAAYILLRAGNPANAVVMFRMNADRYPQSWNTWDSLAEAERAAGNIPDARAHYQKALSLNPGAQDARDALSEMDKTGK